MSEDMDQLVLRIEFLESLVEALCEELFHCVGLEEKAAAGWDFPRAARAEDLPPDDHELHLWLAADNVTDEERGAMKKVIDLHLAAIRALAGEGEEE